MITGVFSAAVLLLLSFGGVADATRRTQRHKQHQIKARNELSEKTKFYTSCRDLFLVNYLFNKKSCEQCVTTKAGWWLGSKKPCVFKFGTGCRASSDERNRANHWLEDVTSCQRVSTAIDDECKKLKSGQNGGCNKCLSNVACVFKFGMGCRESSDERNRANHWLNDVKSCQRVSTAIDDECQTFKSGQNGGCNNCLSTEGKAAARGQNFCVWKDGAAPGESDCRAEWLQPRWRSDKRYCDRKRRTPRADYTTATTIPISTTRVSTVAKKTTAATVRINNTTTTTARAASNSTTTKSTKTTSSNITTTKKATANQTLAPADPSTQAPVKAYDTTKVDKDGNASVIDKSRPTARTPEERKRLREQEIALLREKYKKKPHFATARHPVAHGHNQKVLEMYKKRGGGDAVAAILHTVEAEKRIRLSRSLDSPEPSTSSGGTGKCDAPKDPDEQPSCCSCEDETPSCTGDKVPQYSDEIPCECNPNGGYVCVAPPGAQEGKSEGSNATAVGSEGSGVGAGA